MTDDGCPISGADIWVFWSNWHPAYWGSQWWSKGLCSGYPETDIHWLLVDLSRLGNVK
jgi:hypothetical protein